MSQNQRQNALDGFRDGKFDVLVATDVAARGIDLPTLSLVIHVELPRDAEALQHRSGRTGRAGKKGTAILLVPYQRRRRVEAMLRDARISRIIEGTSEIMRLFIAREALDAHVRRIMPLMTGKGPRGRLLWDAVKFYARWYPKLWLPSAISLNVRHLSPRNPSKGATPRTPATWGGVPGAGGRQVYISAAAALDGAAS